MSAPLSAAEQETLLHLARAALVAAAAQANPPPVAAASLTPALQARGTSFVTLTEAGRLRGCIGGLHAERALYADVQLHAAQAALNDPRFLPVTPAEVSSIAIEISVLTEPQPLAYADSAELPGKLRPHVDGVVLHQGQRRATFLPQVWERVESAEQFLDLLCDKLGLRPQAWRRAHLPVETYQVLSFAEAQPPQPPGPA
ncbi:MAG: AmmeMemoRadiSam system protein A [Anaerolineales bacterium]|nr:AmmeMemoRadiSam system protein A [Anaerolineales bacterium]